MGEFRPVHGDTLPADIGGIVAGQPRHGGGHIARRPEPPGGCAGAKPRNHRSGGFAGTGGEPIGNAAPERGFDMAGHSAIGAAAVGGQFNRQGLGQRMIAAVEAQ